MGITSFWFLCFFACILAVYYIIPGKLQWSFLLLCSLTYYLLTDNGFLILYPLASAAVCYGGIRVLAQTEDARKRKLALAAVVAANIGVLFVLKYINFVINTVNGIAGLAGRQEALLSGWNLLVPLGVSFYTFSLLGYVIDEIGRAHV